MANRNYLTSRSNKLYLGAAAMAVTSFIEVGALGAGLAQAPALAVVGRPLTPVSYAGVARRTSRRTARRTAARTTAYMSTLPAGCTPAGGVYTCGAVTYRSYYDGPNLVYVKVY